MPFDESPSRDGRVNEAIAAYIQAVERGETPDLETFMAKHVEIAGELASFFGNVAKLQKLAGTEDVASVSAPGGPSQSESDINEPTMTFSQRDVPSSRNVLRYFGDYELIEEIARGGMGVVYKARQVTLNRIVAVKMILAGHLASSDDVQRFHTEAEAAAQLDHPGIVPIYEVGEQDGHHYFSMGFVEGQSLAKRVADGPLTPRASAEMVKTIAEAIQYAHDKGVIHRDLKPANILLDKDGKPRVADFGLAKVIERDSDLTGVNQILGTPSYMPPEQAAGQVSSAGRLSDVYSLGAVLYCLLTGRPPFQSSTPLDTLLQVQKQEPVPPRRLNAAIPLDLNTISLKCLEKVPEQRYHSAQEVVNELRRFLTGEPIVARPISLIERGWRRCKRRPLVPSLVAAVLAISAIGGVVISRIAATERRQSLHREVVTAVDAIQNSRGPIVAYTLRDLEKLPREIVVNELKSRYPRAEGNRKLGLAYALANYGSVDVEYLCSQIKSLEGDEVDNLSRSLGQVSDESLSALRVLAAQSESEKEWRLKVRPAIVALHLGVDTIAADMCRINDRPDPVQRTIFIDEFPAWHGDLSNLCAICARSTDPALRSALCMAVGGTGRRSESETAACERIISQWFRSAPDNVTHSAASWALRHWKVDLPVIATSSLPNESHDWFVNSLEMTMLRIHPGRFVRQDLVQNPEDQTVILTRTFFLCDREVTFGQFRQFINDPQCPGSEKPVGWWEDGRSDEVNPVDNVSWYDAILFCNWISRKEGLSPCYERTGKKEDMYSDVNDEWQLVPTGIGYRLPTEAEWEYACRAGTTTQYASGADGKLLGKYAVFMTGDRETIYVQPGAQPTGSKLPNGWGLFDMHGNRSEWCYDWLSEYGTGETRDPAGPSTRPAHRSPHRVRRGGSWDFPPSSSGSAMRARAWPDTRNMVGFRVARSSAQPPQ